MMVFFMGQFALFTYLRPFLEQVTHVTLGLLSSMLLLVGVSGFIGTALIGRVIGDRLHILLGALSAILAAVTRSGRKHSLQSEGGVLPSRVLTRRDPHRGGNYLEVARFNLECAASKHLSP